MTGGLMSKYIMRWERDSVGCGQGGLHDQRYKINKAGFKRFLSQTITDCNKEKTDFKAGGVVVDLCASYNLGNVNIEHLIYASELGYSANDKQNLNPFTRDNAMGAIDEFCGKILLADPDAKDTSGGFSQSRDWPKDTAKGGKMGIAISIMFPSGIGG